MIECKHTEKGSFILRHDILKKLKIEAAIAGKTPVLELEYGNTKYIILTEQFFQELLDVFLQNQKSSQ